MNFSKLRITAIAALLCLSVTACGNSDNSSSAEKKSESNTISEENSATSDTTDESKSSNTEESSEKEAESSPNTATDEIINADIYSMKAQIGDTVFTFPLKAADLFNAGATCSKSENDPDTTTVSYLDNAGYGIMFEGEKYSLSFYHKETEAQPLRNCLIHYPTIEITDDSKIRNGNVILPKGVYVGMPKDDFLKAWGEATIVEGNKYYYSEDDSAKTLNDLKDPFFIVSISSKSDTVESIFLTR